MSGKRDLRAWQDWRDDYRCTRPAVTCQGCDTHYPKGKDEGNAVYLGFNLVSCGECSKRHAEPQILFPHVYKRVFRDVACRYIAIFGGETFSVQTAFDDCEIYLRNRHGETIATVSYSNRFSEPVDTARFDEMPF